MKNFTKSLIAAAVLATSAMSHAGPVLRWQVDAVGEWVSRTPNAVQLTPQVLSWGTSAGGPSSLTITNPAPSEINTLFGGGEPPAENIADSISLTHKNQPINGASLETAGLRVGVELTPLIPLEDQFDLGNIDYTIEFLETPNISGQCIGGSVSVCDDIFVLINGFLNESFDYKGFTYFVNAFPTMGGSLGTLSNEQCEAVLGEGATGCLGFTTPENQSTNLAFGLTISSERLEVPEPGSLALLGLGLAGLAAATRRKQKQA